MDQMSKSPIGQLARLQYEQGNFHVRVPGDHVICAATGQRIHLSQLRYWNADRQEAYVNAAAAHLRDEQLKAPAEPGQG